MRRSKLFAAVMSLASVTLFGCGGGGNAATSARVSGMITYKGQPIRAALMQLHAPGGLSYNVQVSNDGTYSAQDVGVGELIVTVDTESFNPAKTGGTKSKDYEVRMKQMSGGQKRPDDRGGPETPAAAAAAEPYMKIPAKYASAKTSPTTITTKSGRQVINIDLTD
jgi:hypothetical protein